MIGREEGREGGERGRLPAPPPTGVIWLGYGLLSGGEFLPGAGIGSWVEIARCTFHLSLLESPGRPGCLDFCPDFSARDACSLLGQGLQLMKPRGASCVLLSDPGLPSNISLWALLIPYRAPGRL